MRGVAQSLRGLSLLLLTCWRPALCATTYYVNATRPDDSGNGLSWAAAKKTIQAAVDVAAGGDTVLVTNGVYASGGVPAPGLTLTNRVTVVKPVTVRSVSGPAGTIIEGYEPSGTGAVRGVFLSSNAVMTGFTVRYGGTLVGALHLKERAGCGVLIDTAGLLSNCIVRAHDALDDGAGAFLWYGGTVVDCAFRDNHTVNGDGGGVYFYRGGVAVRCTFSGNSATNWSGGGAECYRGGELRDCAFTGNDAYFGGAFRLYYGGVASNCIAHGNQARYGGGVTIQNWGTALYCHVVCNTNLPSGRGAGVYTVNGAWLAGGCVGSNWSQNTAALITYRGAVVSNCLVLGNVNALGNTAGAESSETATYWHCVFQANHAYGYGGGLYAGSMVAVRGCAFIGNTAGLRGGGAHADYGAPLFDACVFISNTAVFGGGGVRLNGSGTLRDCLIARNSAEQAGGADCFGAVTLENCTITDNTASNAGGLRASSGVSNINCVIYANHAQTAATNYVLTDTNVRFLYCCSVPQPDGAADVAGNITNDPSFVSAAAGNYHLQLDSPCIDAGTNLPWMIGATDLDGNPRLVDARVDMGCYEYIPEPAALGLLAASAIYKLQMTIGKRRKRGAAGTRSV